MISIKGFQFGAKTNSRKRADTHRSSFNGIVATVNIISHKQVVGVRALQNKQIHTSPMLELKTKTRAMKMTNNIQRQHWSESLSRKLCTLVNKIEH
jgi:hypothetical protein